MRGAFIKKTRDPAKPHRPTEGICTDAHGWVFSRILYSCSAAYRLVFDAPSAQRIATLSWHAPFSPSQTPFLYVNVVLKRRKPVYIFAPHSFLYYTINTRYDRRQLSYQQRTCVHNAFDDIMEHTIECDDSLETKGIAADIKRR